jgi:hypothetical protein
MSIPSSSGPFREGDRSVYHPHAAKPRNGALVQEGQHFVLGMEDVDERAYATPRSNQSSTPPAEHSSSTGLGGKVSKRSPPGETTANVQEATTRARA